MLDSPVLSAGSGATPQLRKSHPAASLFVRPGTRKVIGEELGLGVSQSRREVGGSRGGGWAVGPAMIRIANPPRKRHGARER